MAYACPPTHQWSVIRHIRWKRPSIPLWYTHFHLAFQSAVATLWLCRYLESTVKGLNFSREASVWVRGAASAPRLSIKMDFRLLLLSVAFLLPSVLCKFSSGCDCVFVVEAETCQGPEGLRGDPAVAGGARGAAWGGEDASMPPSALWKVHEVLHATAVNWAKTKRIHQSLHFIHLLWLVRCHFQTTKATHIFLMIFYICLYLPLLSFMFLLFWVLSLFD